MVNFGLNSASILGLFLAVAGASLYFLRSVRPELSRDHDIFFAAVGLLCGFILLFQGWRLDPILQFGQFLLSGSAIFFAVESIRLRAVATEQARRNTPTVDRERPVSRTRVYREEEYNRDRIEDSYNYKDAKPNYDSPRLRGYDDPQPRRTPRRRASQSREQDVYPPRRRPSSEDLGDRYRPERPNTAEDRPYSSRSEYEDDLGRASTRSDRYYDEPSRNTTRRNPSDPYDVDRNYPTEERNRGYESDRNSNFDELRKRPYDEGIGRSYDEGIGTSYDDEDDVVSSDYVDYQPMDDSSYSDEPRDWDRDEPSDRDERSEWEDNPRRDKFQDSEY
ncbi:MAG: Ycf66 family protein [Xenococcaceae cyanobacterium MO_188.B19]|nr:Ycf66 family protein [Xenococcaceae cyanobacterium MO_188.B19]